MNTGTCTSTGRHPASGLKPCSLWSFCISMASFCRSSPCFSCSSRTSGAIFCIFFIDRTWVTNGLKSSARRVKTRKITDSAQANPLAGSRKEPKTLCQTQRIADTG